MKAKEKKIGIGTKSMSEQREIAQKRVQKIVAVLLILSLSACEKPWHGSDGRPGDAFIALTWYDVEPTYLDAGTGAIPPVFYWGEFYKIRPGIYNLYYEGTVWTGLSWAHYAWEVDYEVWEMPGERGDWYYHGANGPDVFFTIECNPYGPYVESSYKTVGAEDQRYTVLEESNDQVVLAAQKDGYEIKVTYTRIEPSHGQTLHE